MPAPAVATYSAAAKIAAHTALLTLIDTGAGSGSVKIRDSADVLLAEVALTDPAGTVNGTTGQLTITPDGREESAPASGAAAYAELCAVNGDVVLALPTESGTVAVANKCVINDLNIVAGLPVELISLVIG
jgi:hypothetical protein